MKPKCLVKKILSLMILLVLVTLSFISIPYAEATNVINSSANEYVDGDYQISHLLGIVTTVVALILSLTGTAVLVAFVYGGFLFLVSAGSSERIGLAKNVIKGAVIGMVIVFLSFTIITFVFEAFDVTGNWWESTWFNSK